MKITVKFINDHGTPVVLRGECGLDYIDHFDVCGDAVYIAKSKNMDDVTSYIGDGGVQYFPLYFYSSEEYGEDYEVHVYFSSSRCWVVSHITAYDGCELLYEIGGRTQKISIKIK